MSNDGQDYFKTGRPCTANDIILVAQGIQCCNCGNVSHHGGSINHKPQSGNVQGTLPRREAQSTWLSR